MAFAVLAALLLILCAATKKWKHWKEYYSTILYLYIGDLTCTLLLFKKPLWLIDHVLFKYLILYVSITAWLYTGTVILFLSYYPFAKPMQKRLSYFSLWVALYTVTELIAYLTGDFLYFHGWNIFISLLFNVTMFCLVRLHYKKPLLAWPISLAFALSVLLVFKIPLAR